MFGKFAVSVAVNNPPQALALAERLPKKDERDRCRANVAAAMDDLAKAEEILKSIEPWPARRARARLAYRIAPTRPAEAIRLIETMSSNDGNENAAKAQAFGWLAVAIAPHDRAQSHRLIDRAFATYLKPGERSYGGYGGSAARAALLTVLARQIGYPDLQSAEYRVLALRPTGRDVWSPAGVQETTVMIALFLGLIDPPAAKGLLQSVEAASDVIGTGGSGIGRRDWLVAWALTDPEHAVELATRELATAKNAQAKQNAFYTVTETVQLLLTAPGERLKHISQNKPDMASPDREY
jgi:hypothetical protein